MVMEETAMEEMSESIDKYFLLNDTTMIVRVNYPDNTYVSGILDVKAIRGCVQIMGYKLTPSSPAVTLSSLKEYNTLNVTTLEDDTDKCDTEFLLSAGAPQDLMKEIARNQPCYSHVYVIRRNNDAVNFISYLRNYSFPTFAKEITEDSITNALRSDERSRFLESEEWHSVVDLVMKSRKVLLCGGKNTGKSTLLRYLVNRSVEKRPVMVLDLDIGQSEFTVMGCVSAVLVQQPLLGPNFSHFIPPVKCLFIGDISVANCTQFYFKCVQHIADFCHTNYQHIPWIINTMGFTKGLGIEVLRNIINSVKPDDVVQIDHEKKAVNFPELVTPEFLVRATSKGCYWNYGTHLISAVSGHTKPDIVTGNWDPLREKMIDTVTCNSVSVSKKWKKSNLSNVSSVSESSKRKFDGGADGLNANEVEIIIRKPSSSHLEMTLNKSQKLCCINGCMVALCSPETEDLFHCRGFGIVRGYDVDTEVIFVATPLTNEELKKVTVIQMGSNVQLPQIVYQYQVPRVHGPCPYMTFNKKPERLNQLVKRTTSRLKQ